MILKEKNNTFENSLNQHSSLLMFKRTPLYETFHTFASVIHTINKNK